MSDTLLHCRGYLTLAQRVGELQALLLLIPEPGAPLPLPGLFLSWYRLSIVL